MCFFYGYIHWVIHQFFISLAVLGLTCSMQDLPSLLQHVRSLAVACGIQFPDQGLNPGPLHWERGVLATEPPEKSFSDRFSNANSTYEESIHSSFLYLTKNQHKTPVTFRRKQDIGSWTGRKGKGSCHPGWQWWEKKEKQDWEVEDRAGGMARAKLRSGDAMVPSVNNTSHMVYSLLDQSVWRMKW